MPEKRDKLCLRQSASDSTGPQINIAANRFRQLARDDDVAVQEPSSGPENPEDLSERLFLSGVRFSTPFEMTTSTLSESTGRDIASPRRTSTLASPRDLAPFRARSAIASVMSTPIARPPGPTAWATNSRSIPRRSRYRQPWRQRSPARCDEDWRRRRTTLYCRPEAGPMRRHHSQASPWRTSGHDESESPDGSVATRR